MKLLNKVWESVNSESSSLSLSPSPAAVHVDILASSETVGERHVQQEEEVERPAAGGHHWRCSTPESPNSFISLNHSRKCVGLWKISLCHDLLCRLIQLYQTSCGF